MSLVAYEERFEKEQIVESSTSYFNIVRKKSALTLPYLANYKTRPIMRTKYLQALDNSQCKAEILEKNRDQKISSLFILTFLR